MKKKHPFYINNKKQKNKKMILEFYYLENHRENNYKLKCENKNFLKNIFQKYFLILKNIENIY